MSRVVCFGGANVDVKAKTLRPPILETSNPVKTSFYFGGVARNIAENMARLKVPASLISHVGSDSQGDRLLAYCQSIGIHTAGVSRSLVYPTGTFTALLDEQGELFIAMADMEIYEELTPAVIAPALMYARHAPYWLVDGNLKETTLKYIADQKPSCAELWAMPASIPKASRLKAILSDIHTLILNVSELAELASAELNDLHDVENACQKVRSQGVKNILVTRGKDGVYVDSEDFSRSFRMSNVVPVDVLGAGDSFSSGVLFGRQKGLSLSESISCGLAMALLALQTHHSLPQNLSLDILEKTKEHLAIH